MNGEKFQPHYEQPEQQAERLGEEAERPASVEKPREQFETKEPEGPSIDQIQEKIKDSAISGKEVNMSEHEQPQPQTAHYNQRELKAEAYKRTLQKISKRLGAPERSLSHIVHQPAIESASDASSKTIARPSGILGGGIVSLLGSGVLLYMAKYYGFKYNFFAFFLLFAAGYILGLVAESLLRLFGHRQKNS